MGTEKELWEKCVKFHGHVCPGLSLGYKAAMIALRELGVTNLKETPLAAIVEHKGCGLDAVQVVTGCTEANENLHIRDYGKQVYTIGLGKKRGGKALRIVLKPNLLESDSLQLALRAKVRKGEATPEEKEMFIQKNRELCQKIINMPEEDFCQITEVEAVFPAKSTLPATVICAKCGEGVLATHVCQKDGRQICKVCAGEI